MTADRHRTTVDGRPQTAARTDYFQRSAVGGQRSFKHICFEWQDGDAHNVEIVDYH